MNTLSDLIKQMHRLVDGEYESLVGYSQGDFYSYMANVFPEVTRKMTNEVWSATIRGSKMEDKQIEAAITKIVEDEGEMSFPEIYAEVEKALTNMRSNVNNSGVREDLAKLSNWGFYNGPVYAALGGEEGITIARDIANQALEYLKEIKHIESSVYELYDEVYHYAT